MVYGMIDLEEKNQQIEVCWAEMDDQVQRMVEWCDQPRDTEWYWDYLQDLYEEWSEGEEYEDFLSDEGVEW